MPSKTFLNLSEEKQNRIISAAIKEFSSVPLEKASINKIIKDAEISRGSFYMYFEDKYDLTLYLFNTITHYVDDISKKIELSTSGKLDEYIIRMNEILYDFYTQEKYRRLIFNLISQFQRFDQFDMKCFKGKKPILKEIERIVQSIDKDQFKNQDRDYIIGVIEISLNSLRSVIFKTILEDLSKEESTKILTIQLSILKQGYGRNE